MVSSLQGAGLEGVHCTVYIAHTVYIVQESKQHYTAIHDYLNIVGCGCFQYCT